MSNFRLIIFIIIFFLLGFIIYKVKHYEFTDNSKFILNLLFEELCVINSRLKKQDITNEERIKLIEREKEIHFTLEQFFGKNLKENK